MAEPALWMTNFASRVTALSSEKALSPEKRGDDCGEEGQGAYRRIAREGRDIGSIPGAEEAVSSTVSGLGVTYDLLRTLTAA